jgi:hypothetical protein
MLILPMPFGAFQPPKPAYRILLRYPPDGHGYIFSCATFPRALLMLHDAQRQVAGDVNVKRACMAAENVDVAAGQGKMLAVLVLGPRERPWRVRPVRASVVEKLRTA